ncbi:MspA family porin [Nocardia wallacei]|uniref:MspA family porin n=1 Tax=Nocardia wallacei TaxID=480035 RepID=UPI002457E1C6|nr:MspA family porin [Nocardia wallacei]
MIRSIALRCGRVSGLALAVAVGMGLCSAGAANADTFVPLPGGSITATLGDGTEVTLSIVDESAKISGSMGATPLHRNVWTSGRVIADVSGPGASSAGIQLNPGYVVGCQVDIASLTSQETDTQGTTTSNGALVPAAPVIGATETLTIGPGQAVARYLLDIEQPDDYGNEDHKRHPTVKGSHASVSWTDETFAVNGCGGYAQARAFTMADVSTDAAESMITVWGAPFSIG